MMRPMPDAPAGRIRGPIHRWPIDERPAVWVTIAGHRHPAREHATAENGKARLVAWGADYRWVRATDVTPRDDVPETPPSTTQPGTQPDTGNEHTP